jgi:membrane associated rhomboid family serine protease
LLPIRDDNPTLGRSFATFLLIGLNLGAWAFVEGLGSPAAVSRAVCELGLIPAELLGTAPAGTAVPLGRGSVCVLQAHGHWFTVFTSMFLHGSWFHILGNLWFLWVFGDNVEDVMGPVRFVAFYLACGCAAVAAQILSSPDSTIPMIGASGAIGGVMGAYALLFPFVRVHMLIILFFWIERIIVPAWLMLGYWFLVQLLSGIPALGATAGGVAFWAHVGGFLAGGALVFVFRDPRRVAAQRALRERTL